MQGECSPEQERGGGGPGALLALGLLVELGQLLEESVFFIGGQAEWGGDKCGLGRGTGLLTDRQAVVPGNKMVGTALNSPDCPDCTEGARRMKGDRVRERDGK